MFHHSTFDAIQIVVKTLEAQPILQTQVLPAVIHNWMPVLRKMNSDLMLAASDN